MIIFNYEGNKYSVKNLISELNLEEFSRLNNIISYEEDDNISKWCKVLEYLGLKEEFIDMLSIDDLSQYINNAFKDKVTGVVNNQIVIDGYTYECKMNNNKPDISVIDLKWIEKMLQKGPSYLIAVIFKRTDLSKKEHFDRSHIYHKAYIIGKSMSAVQALYFLTYISQEINKTFRLIGDESIK